MLDLAKRISFSLSYAIPAWSPMAFLSYSIESGSITLSPAIIPGQIAKRKQRDRNSIREGFRSCFVMDIDVLELRIPTYQPSRPSFQLATSS